MRHVIAFGNTLHGDDGVAAAVLATLGAMSLPTDVRLFDAGTRGLDALALFEHCAEAILIDAAVPAGEPGAICQPDPAELLPDDSLSWHSGGVSTVLRALQALDATPPRLYLLTIEAGQRVAFAPGLSPAVAAAVGPAAEHVRRHLEKSS